MIVFVARKIIIWISVLGVMSLCFIFPATIYASGPSLSQEEAILSNIDLNITVIRYGIEQMDSQQAVAEAALKQIDSEIVAEQAKINIVVSKISVAKSKINTLTKNIAYNKKIINKDRSIEASQLEEVYLYGDTAPLAVLFGNTRSGDIQLALFYFKAINNGSTAIISQIETRTRQVASDLAEVVAYKATLTDLLAKDSEELASIQAKMAAQKSDVLAVSANIANAQSLLGQYNSAYAQAVSVIKQIIATINSYTQGTIPTSQLWNAVVGIANTYGVSPYLVMAVIRQESGGNPNAKSSAGALGLMQLMPTTASGLGVTNPLNPTQNLQGGIKDLAGLLSEFNGNVQLALAAYNAGSGSVIAYGGIPPYAQTQNYVRNVMAMYQDYLKNGIPGN